MEEPTIWNDMHKAPALQHESIYLLYEDNSIIKVFYYDEEITPWVNYRMYFCGVVAWAYVDNIVNL